MSFYPSEKTYGELTYTYLFDLSLAVSFNRGNPINTKRPLISLINSQGKSIACPKVGSNYFLYDNQEAKYLDWLVPSTNLPIIVDPLAYDGCAACICSPSNAGTVIKDQFIFPPGYPLFTLQSVTPRTYLVVETFQYNDEGGLIRGRIVKDQAFLSVILYLNGKMICNCNGSCIPSYCNSELNVCSIPSETEKNIVNNDEDNTVTYNYTVQMIIITAVFILIFIGLMIVGIMMISKQRKKKSPQVTKAQITNDPLVSVKSPPSYNFPLQSGYKP